MLNVRPVIAAEPIFIPDDQAGGGILEEGRVIVAVRPERLDESHPCRQTVGEAG